ncbi:calcium pump1 [Corchorus olitorius]|uniref:Calcium pump1 n=1 Tax=Corchorus olitorius TaxID=93759 RepID=A0A1R3KIJ5_9ROSI|nr:calcium pump1 [Corchorus olitorius]
MEDSRNRCEGPSPEQNRGISNPVHYFSFGFAKFLFSSVNATGKVRNANPNSGTYIGLSLRSS